jgi:hypothetical protein
MKLFTYSTAMILSILIASCASGPTEDSNVLYESDEFTVYKDSVVQGKNKAVILSPEKMTSNYQSSSTENYSNLVSFKLTKN